MIGQETGPYLEILEGDSQKELKGMIEEICSDAMDSSNALHMLLTTGLFSSVFMKPEHKALLPLILILEKKKQKKVELKKSKLNQVGIPKGELSMKDAL